MARADEVMRAVTRALVAAERERRPVDPPTARYPDLTPAEAYAVKREAARLRRASGARQVGWKVAAPSPAAQRSMGLDGPDFGYVFDTVAVDAHGRLRTAALIAPRLEVEIAFVMEEHLRGPGVDAARVRRAARVAPAFEIVDCRVRDWQVRGPDFIADNAVAAGVRLGEPRPLAGDLDLGAVTARLLVDGAPAAEGSGATVMGDSARSVAWLCNRLADVDLALEPGQIVMPGSLTAPIDLRPGRTYTARFDRLGEVALRAE